VSSDVETGVFIIWKIWITKSLKLHANYLYARLWKKKYEERFALFCIIWLLLREGYLIF